LRQESANAKEFSRQRGDRPHSPPISSLARRAREAQARNARASGGGPRAARVDKEGAMYKRIILAVDLAEPGPRPKGLDQAVELVKASGGDLRLVNIQPLLPATFMEYVPADFDEEQEKRAEAAIKTTAGAVDLPVGKVSSVVRVGGIYHELLQEAVDWNADLIVVGSHRPVMSDYLLGSNAKTIVRHAQCSVLVVRD
jgi:nucleotide-binding universal stress UspA family protein